MRTILNKKEKRYAGGIVLAVAVLLIVLSFTITKIPWGGNLRWHQSLPDDVIPFLIGTMFCIGTALIALAVVLFRRLPLIEANKPMSIVLFLEGCGVNLLWPLWIISSGLCIYYLVHLKKTNGKKGTAITLLVLSFLGLVFVIVYALLNGFDGRMLTLFGMTMV